MAKRKKKRQIKQSKNPHKLTKTNTDYSPNRRYMYRTLSINNTTQPSCKYTVVCYQPVQTLT